MRKMLVPLMLLVFASFVKAPPKNNRVTALRSEALGRGHVIVDAGHGRKSGSPHRYGVAVAGAGVGDSLSAADRRSSHAGAVSPRAVNAPGTPRSRPRELSGEPAAMSRNEARRAFKPVGSDVLADTSTAFLG